MRIHTKKIMSVVILVILFVAFGSCSNNENADFIEAIYNKAISSNVLLLNVEYTCSENVSLVSFSEGFSGVIFRRDEDEYYVLTAYHALPAKIGGIHSEIIVMGYDQPTYGKAVLESNQISQEAYYAQYPRAVIEYYDDKYDLAILSFNSTDEYTVLPVASDVPQYNETVATISNPHGFGRNTITIGKICSKEPVPFGDKAGETQYNIIEHTAEVYQGSSGSVLLNKDMEIVGINLGGSENALHQFLRGKAMPCNSILDFINDMDNS